MVTRKPLVRLDSGIIGELPAGDDIVSTAYTVVTSSTPLVVGDRIAADSTLGTFTLTLPAAPVAGDSILIKDHRRTWKTTPITLDPGAIKIEGCTGAFSLNYCGIGIELVYVNTTVGWQARITF